MRASSLSYNTVAINREIDSRYDIIKEVSEHLDEIAEALSSASTASTAASSATVSAATASTKASEVSASVTASASNASAALTSKNAAAASEASALTYKNSASTSATTATTKASEASTSAAAALVSETNANTSKNSAATSATTATTKASEASASATTASVSATNAASSASSALTSASTSTTKASEASASASTALGYKNDISTMKVAIETIYDTFDDRFLGTKTVNPTVDNDGNALIDGALYFDTTTNAMKVYDIGTTTWYAMPQIYLNSLLDVELTSLTTGHILVWNGTKWENGVISKASIGLANVDNTSDASKPVSTVQQTALNLKANLVSPTFTGTVSGVTKAMVGLDSVDNTADSAKNVLSATKLTTARTIGGVSFNGTANINLPGVNTAGNQGTTGNAATATKLQTARTINGVAFDGSANITVSDSTKVAKTSDTGSAKLPVGTTAQRDAVPVEGMIRYNSTTLGFEGYSNGMWQPVAVKNDTKKRRNYLINGNFGFWDYATSQTTAGYGSDNRWDNVNIGSTKVHSRMTSSDIERALFESQYYSRTVVSSVSAATSAVLKKHKIEDVTKLAGKTVTLSFWIKADSSKNIAVEFTQIFGSGGTPSSTSSAASTVTVAVTSIWQKKTVTISLASIVGKTLGTDGVHTTFTQIGFWFDAGSNHSSAANSLGQQSGTFDIAEVKLEDGLVTTDGWAPYDGEWGSEAIARMRYYEVGTVYGLSYASSATAYQRFMINYKVIKRVIPSISLIKTSGIASVGTPSVINDDNCVVAFTATASSQEWFGTFTSAAEL